MRAKSLSKTVALCLASLIFALLPSIQAQGEVVTNGSVIEMSRSGLSPEIIRSKILRSDTSFDVTAKALIELKENGVADDIIALMLERADAVLPGTPPRQAATPVSYSENVDPNTEPKPESYPTERPAPDPKEAIRMARTIAFKKSSAHPSRQNLEKALLKNANFNKLNLTILRYKEEADIFVEIGFVSGSWLTHRYVYRIFDRRSGAVLAAGETTSWGSLADNLARHISRSLVKIRDN
ncbi:MAG: hypothetical protein IPM21_00840 [Acidobacteria bacterium]|nr:hypothetical protein [Acidobacteriota bacterium]